MFGKSSAILLIAAFLEALPVNADGIYTKNSPVLQVDGSSYDRLIARSNHASIVEFYAPWCGHCQNLKPAFEKAAKNLDGLAKVAAVNCDEDSNKQFCGQMGVQGFPTLKIVVPSKKPGKPRVEDYQGARTAKAIVDAVVDKIPNHVKRVTDKDLNSWLEEEKETAKAILFTEKGTTSALLRALAIDYLGSINFAQIRNKEASTVEKFGVDKFPTLVLLPGGDNEAITYDGEMKKQSMSKFLSQAAEPNPDPASKQSKSSSKSKKSSKPSASTVSDDEATAASKATESSEPSTHTPSANEPPKPPPLQILINNEDLGNACLSSKTGTCVLVLVSVPEPSDSKPPPAAIQSFSSLAEISHKHSQRGGHLFPFYVVPDNAVEDVSMLRNKLELSQDGAVEIIAVNAKRGWWRRYDAGENSDFSVASLESWIDAIRLGEGAKKKLPEGVVREAAEEPKEPVTEPEPEPLPEQEAGEPEEPVVGGEAEQEPLEEKPSGHSEL
ncbi:hypothetical protein FQN55_005480 [Onygenales sp. PD_40]|nr:hypothetical protein FQN55_005480 [Onygenales sp. PD_40]KAK2790349.1 hypothetical protein FQN52_005617 [Onygenales sp. PD_12]KAK2797969.1 hypothetical protein FQN51_008148 [Onygenales sp. PD_10]